VGKELISALAVLFTNPTFLFVSVAGACEGFLMQGIDRNRRFFLTLTYECFPLMQQDKVPHVE
jgi:hypothetical protein